MRFWERFKATNDLELRMLKLEVEMKQFRLDADDMYERYRKMSARIAKRAKVDAEPIETGEGPTATDELAASQPGNGLSPRQRLIQQQILRRRGGFS